MSPEEIKCKRDAVELNGCRRTREHLDFFPNAMPFYRCENRKDAGKTWHEQLDTLGAAFSDIPPTLKKLTPDDYSAGPMSEPYGLGGETWLFGPQFKRQDAYVKYTFRQEDNVMVLIVWSFHKPKPKLHCPLQLRAA